MSRDDLAADTAERADANFVAHVTWAPARTPGMVSRAGDALVIADSGLPCDTFNFVCRVRLTAATARPAALEAVAYFAGVKRPFSWWVGPADRPRDLGAVLGDIGLERAESERAMALPLADAAGTFPPVAGLEVRRVRGEAELEALARIAAANWTPPDPHVPTFYRRAAAVLLDPASPQWFYLGYLNGEPVATAEATLHAGTVGLYNIATLAAFRRRGIGTALTWQPLRDAKAAGCDLAVLQAAPDGVGLYRRLGFVPFGEITEYKPARYDPSRSTAARASVT
ncbi:MAG TPA: GNAT family N-acetyltransferase [Gemmatimonadales bacterium]|nr:GNAT family N-acetyltransferase [Gemmatimonadales bacterium]